MNIAFMAHDKKKELMVQFCAAYKSVLAKHTLMGNQRHRTAGCRCNRTSHHAVFVPGPGRAPTAWGAHCL